MTKTEKEGPDPIAHPARDLAPGLYLVSTPIGNARDITLRALDVLNAADTVLCEDTRVTSRLFAIHGISTKLSPYHEHNARAVRPGILDRLEDGARIALVSDAGTPLVSDPGYRLVAEAAARGLAVYPVPGASAVLAGLSVSGLPTDRFLFCGFLPPKTGARTKALGEMTGVTASLVFLETGPRLASALRDMASVLGGDRPAAVCRELTIKFEETRRGTLADLAAHYTDAPVPKGELTLVVGPPDKAAAQEKAAASLDEALAGALKDLSVKEASALVAADLGLPKRQVYARAVALKQKEQP